MTALALFGMLESFGVDDEGMPASSVLLLKEAEGVEGVVEEEDAWEGGRNENRPDIRARSAARRVREDEI